MLVLERGYLNAGRLGPERRRRARAVDHAHDDPARRSRSLELCDRFAVEMGVNVWFRRGGYLFLAPTARAGGADRAERGAAPAGGAPHPRPRARRGARGGAGARPPRASSRPPGTPTTRVVFPWPFLWGYAGRAEALGAKVRTFTRVTGFEVAGPRVTAVRDRSRPRRLRARWSSPPAPGRRRSPRSPAWRSRTAPPATRSSSTEPLKPWLGPLVSVLGNGLYFSQSQRGEIVGGMGDPREPEGVVAGLDAPLPGPLRPRRRSRLLPRLARREGGPPVGGLLRRHPRQQPRSSARPGSRTSTSSPASSATAS